MEIDLPAMGNGDVDVLLGPLLRTDVGDFEVAPVGLVVQAVSFELDVGHVVEQKVMSSR